MMKRKSLLTIGISLGIVLTLGIQVFAAPAIERIEAYVNNQFTFEFDGTEKKLSDDYEVIVYKDRSYVPVRFVAENLGATVDWDNAAKMIKIQSKAPEVVEKPQEDIREYRELPLYKENVNFKMSVVLFSDDEYGYKISAVLENKTDTPIQLDQLKTIVVADGVEHSMDNVSITQLDTRWYNDILKDKKTEGYVRLPNTLDEPKNLHLEFQVRTNGAIVNKTETMAFDIAI